MAALTHARLRRSCGVLALVVIGAVSCSTTNTREPSGNARPSTSATTSRSSNPSTTSPEPSSSAPSPPDSPRPKPSPLTTAQQVARVLRDPSPDPAEIVRLAGAPTSWVKGKDTLLVQYGLGHRYDWPRSTSVATTRVLDRGGRVLGEWVDGGRDFGTRTYWPAGRDFVGVWPDRYKQGSGQPVLVRNGSPRPLTALKGARAAEAGDVRFGDGWLLDRAAGTVTRERIPGCRPGTIRNDVRHRIWCLDRPKRHIAWSDDHGQTWTRHALSTSYFEWCDGGAFGSDLEVLGDVVAIGLWRADFSLDRGRTWHDVPLPYRRVGAHRGGGQSGSFPNCTQVRPIAGGRLVLRYFGSAIARDPSNTEFSAVPVPRRTSYVGVIEGALTAASHSPFGNRYVSFDGGRTWQRSRVSALLRHLLQR